MENLLYTQDLCKYFSGNCVLDQVNFSLCKGEIHGLVGANGSGKSTFLNILNGSSYIQETGGYQGKIFIDGQAVSISHPQDAISLGIGMVHQELALFNKLNASENVYFNHEKTRYAPRLLSDDFALLDNTYHKAQSSKIFAQLAVNIDPEQNVQELPLSLKQFVEIARVISKSNLRILLLDEPTASLAPEETGQFFQVLKNLAHAGLSIIFISHRLEEIQALCDRATVFRNGCLIKTYEGPEIDPDKLALDMLGEQGKRRHLANPVKSPKASSTHPLLSFNNVEVSRHGHTYPHLCLDIMRGEILGVCGLAGQGQELLGYGLCGLYEMSGEVIFDHEVVCPGDMENLFSKGIYLLPDERKEKGLMLNRSVQENMLYGSWSKQPHLLKQFSPLGLSFFKQKNIESSAQELAEKLNIQCASLTQAVGELSGGNQQKVCVARALAVQPKLCFINEPTRGMDVYSKSLILEAIVSMNQKENITLVISSSELEELRDICQRIVIMYEGKIVGIFPATEKIENLALALAGRYHHE